MNSVLRFHLILLICCLTRNNGQLIAPNTNYVTVCFGPIPLIYCRELQQIQWECAREIDHLAFLLNSECWTTESSKHIMSCLISSLHRLQLHFFIKTQKSYSVKRCFYNYSFFYKNTEIVS